MSILPLLVIVQAFIVSTWSMVMLTAYLVTRDDDHPYESLDLTAANVAGAPRAEQAAREDVGSVERAGSRAQ